MSNYRAYTHIERANKPQAADVMSAPLVSVQPKIDGTNACIWADDDANIHCGSRTREVGETKDIDNQGFCKYMKNDDAIKPLRTFCMNNPNYIVYGEWLGQNKCLGSIKKYIKLGFWVFDVYDTDTDDYLLYEDWSRMLGGIYDQYVPELWRGAGADLTQEKIDSLLESNHFNLPADVIGEGIVIKAQPSVLDSCGCPAIAKIVRDEFHQKKSRPKKVYAPSENELQFVDECCTAAFLDKCRNKVSLALGEDFDESNHKHIGYMMCLAVDDIMREEFWDFFKKKKGQVNLSMIDKLVKAQVREFLGL